MGLDAKQVAPLTGDELEELRTAAAERGIGNGQLTRALVLHGLDHLDDRTVAEAIEAEKAHARERLSAGAREAVRQRWGQKGAKG